MPLALAIALVVAGCGTTPPTQSPTAPSTTGPTSPPPTASPSNAPAIVPVPTPVFVPDPSGPQLDSGVAAKLQSVVDAYRAKSHVPGLVAAVVFPDGEMWTGQAGAAVLSSGEPTSADTVFSVASISKTFVAALVLRLAERGVLGLDDPLSRYVPSFPNAAHITLRQLLTHTSGLQDIFTSPGVGAAGFDDPQRIWTPAEVLGMIGTPSFAHGKGYHYSNTNYLLLGLVIEKATGQKLATLVHQEFLEPLGMTDTFVQTEERAQGQLAHGYAGTAGAPRDVTDGSTILPFNAEASVCGASCEFASTAVDLARWATALYGGAVLDPAALASMVDVSTTAPYGPHYLYGLGFEEWTLAGRTAWGHRGHLDGFWSAMTYLRQARVTVVVLTNAEWGDPLSVAGDLATAVLGPAPAPTPTATATARP